MTTEPVTPEQLAAIPEEHRVLVARWLYERVVAIQPSFVLPPAAASAIQDVMAGAAVDLVDPLADDSTLEHAAGLVEKIRAGAARRFPVGPPRHVPPDHFRATGGVDG